MKKIFLTILIFAPLVLAAQVERKYEFPRFRYGVEFGFETFAGNKVEIPQIRENKSAYSDPYHHDDFYNCGFMFDKYGYTRLFVGFKPEFSLNHHFVAAAGLRLSYNNSVLNSDRGYFLWKVAENGQTTDYVRVNDLTQNNFYLGVPLELTIFTSQRDLRVRQYFKAGFVFNALLASSTNPRFVTPAMENIYKDKIVSQLKKPSAFGAQAFLGFGMKIGRMNKPFGSVEIQMPVNLLKNQRASSFVYTAPVSFAMVATVDIPAGKQKLSYTYRSRR